MKRINLMLPVRMLKALRKLETSKQLSVSEVIRRAIDQYLDAQ